MPIKKLKLDEVCFALREEAGLLTRACVRLNCSRNGLAKFIQRHPKALEVLHDARESLIDDAEAGLRKAVQDGEWRAIMFVLTVLGKKRGFRESWLRDPLYTDPLDPEYVEPGGRRRIDDLEDDWPESEPGEPDLEAELIEAFQAERQTLLARIRELESAPAVSTTDTPAAPDEAELAMRAEIQSLMAQVRRKLGEDHPA
jgi:hypothetical protein